MSKYYFKKGQLNHVITKLHLLVRLNNETLLQLEIKEWAYVSRAKAVFL